MGNLYATYRSKLVTTQKMPSRPCRIAAGGERWNLDRLPVCQHRGLILNYFRAQKLLSRGVVEGLNNTAEVTIGKACGFRTFRVLEFALYHGLAKLPEPKTTHDFF
jgi:Transposase